MASPALLAEQDSGCRPLGQAGFGVSEDSGFRTRWLAAAGDHDPIASTNNAHTAAKQETTAPFSIFGTRPVRLALGCEHARKWTAVVDDAAGAGVHGARQRQGPADRAGAGPGALPGGVSASGAVVVGGLATVGGFYWMPTTGAIYIGGLGATSVSGDGSTIVGAAADSRGIQAAIWQRAAEWRLLGSFRPGASSCGASLSSASDTSRDGQGRGRPRVGWVQRSPMPSGGTTRPAWWTSGVPSPDRAVARTAFRQTARSWSASRRPRPASPRAPSGWTAGSHCSRDPGAWWERRRPRTIDGSIVVGRVCNPSAASTHRSDLSKRLGVDEAGRLEMPAGAEAAGLARPADHRRGQGDERRWPGDRRRHRTSADRTTPTPSSGSTASPSISRTTCRPTACRTRSRPGSTRARSPTSRRTAASSSERAPRCWASAATS